MNAGDKVEWRAPDDFFRDVRGAMAGSSRAK